MSAVVDTPVVSRHGLPGLAAGPVVASAAAVLAVVAPLSGLSYPGFPIDAAAGAAAATGVSLTVAVVLAVRARRSGRRRLRATVVLAVVAVVLTGGVVAARADDGRRLQARWTASQGAFEQEVSTVGVPVLSQTSDTFAPYPGACPVRLGELGVAGCRSIDGGYLFPQVQGALTDDSRIVYLPEVTRAASTWWSTETMTPLGGPWWSWTCGC